MGTTKVTNCFAGLGLACLVLISLVVGPIFIDIDHPICVVANGLPLTWENALFYGCRSLHLASIPMLGILALVATALSFGWAIIVNPEE